MIPNTLAEEAITYVDNANLLNEKTKRWSELSENIIRRKIELCRKQAK